MTAHELARLLLAGPDVLVVLDGYEGGLTEARPPRPIRIALNVHDRRYAGPHDHPDGGFWDDSMVADTDAVYLSRYEAPVSDATPGDVWDEATAKAVLEWKAPASPVETRITLDVDPTDMDRIVADAIAAHRLGRHPSLYLSVGGYTHHLIVESVDESQRKWRVVLKEVAADYEDPALKGGRS
jgi:hypothetical protein